MASVKDIFDALNELAPVSTKMDFDNVGFLVGFGDEKVTRIVAALDVTTEVIDEAAELGAQLVVSHHPMFFSLKTVNDGDVTGRNITKLLRNGMSAICMHTNLDAAKTGVNHTLALRAGIAAPELLTDEGRTPDGEPYSCGRFGYLAEKTAMREYLPFIKNVLKTNGLRYYDSGRPVHKLAVVGGSGGSYLHEAFGKGCDTILTADIKYDVFLEAKALGMNIIDGDHFCTENLVIPEVRDYLAGRFPETETVVSRIHKQTAEFFV